MTESNSAPENAGAGHLTSGQTVQMSQGALDGLIGNAKREAAERERSKLSSEYEAKLQEREAKLREEAVEIARKEAERLIEEREKRKSEQEQQKQIEQAHTAIKDKLVPKFEEGRKKYSDWNDTVLSYDWQDEKYKKILPLLACDNDIDNQDEILHHLCENGHIEKLASRNPNYIMSKIKEISSSLKSNKEKPIIDAPPEPIKSLKPSHVKTKGDGDMTLEDFRKASWLKG